MSKIIVIINQSNKTKLFEVTIGACLDKNDTFVMSYSILNMLEYMLEYIMKKNEKYVLNEAILNLIPK